MPEYLAPGVYIEETSFRAKSIEGVSTTTTGFVGPTRFGPLDIEPDVVTSLVEFERTYGGRDKLSFEGGEVDNYMWHAVRAFFEEGGKRLYVSRVFAKGQTDGFAKPQYATVPPEAQIPVQARFPGESGNGRVTFTLRSGQNILIRDETPGVIDRNKVRSLADRDVVWIKNVTPPQESPPTPGSTTSDFYSARWDAQNQTWDFVPRTGTTLNLQTDLSPLDGDEVHIVTASVVFDPLVSGAPPFVAADLPLDPSHQRNGVPDSIFALLSRSPANLGLARTTPIVLDTVASTLSTPAAATGLDLLERLDSLSNPVTSPPANPPVISIKKALTISNSALEQRSVSISLVNGSDGVLPAATHYEGGEDAATGAKFGLRQFEDIEDISIVAAPGSTQGYAGGQSRAQTIIGLLLSHAERMRYRIAVIDCGDRQTVADVRAMRARFDSKYGAFYYPWVRTVDPLTQREIYLPPSGFVSGIYARNDVNRAVYKAPANEVVNLAIGFEQMLNKAQQEVLNPEGVNCFRFFEGRGMRLWGARTMSSDPEWKYVNIRRYFGYLERSIDKGTQWAVFEPNGDQLWANVRRTIEDFLLNEWQGGALLGEKPERAFFVKCDRSTMSQNDLDNGRLICLIGIAPVKPAEFVIFRIGQWTADRKI